MIKIARRFTLLAIFLYPTDGFKFAIIPSLSLYRIALIISVVFWTLGCLEKKTLTVPETRVLPYAFVACFSAFLSIFISTEAEYASSAMLNEFSGVMMLILIVSLFGYDDINILLKQYIRSAYIGIPFALITWIILFKNPAMLEKVCSLGGLFKFDITEELIISCYNMRLVLPYSSSSVYSGVLAVTISILLCDNQMFQRRVRNFLIAIFSLMLVMTQGRTGLLSLAFFIFLFLLRMRNNKEKAKMVLLGIVAIVCIWLFIGSDKEFIRKLITRFDKRSSGTTTSIFEDRHFLLPLEGLRIWLSCAKNFLIGIGYGSSINIKGLWTYIPYFFFNSFITQIVDKGIFGLIIVVFWLETKVRLGKVFKDRDFYSSRNKVNAAFTVLLLCCLTYEFYPYYAFFIIFASALLCVNNPN